MSSVVDDGYLAFVGMAIATCNHLSIVKTQTALGCQIWFSWERMSEEDKEFFRTLEDDKQQFLVDKWAGTMAYKIAVAKATDGGEVSPTMVAAQSTVDHQRAAAANPILNLSQMSQSPFHGESSKTSFVARWIEESSAAANNAVGHVFMTPTAELPDNFIQPGSQEKRNAEQLGTPSKRARKQQNPKSLSLDKKPKSAYIRFSMEKYQQLKKIPGKDMLTIGRIAGAMWRKMSLEQKQPYMEAYKADMEQYNQQKSRVNAALAAIDNQMAGGDDIAVGQDVEVKAKDVVEAVGGEEIITDEEVAMLQAAQELLDVGAFKDDDEEVENVGEFDSSKISTEEREEDAMLLQVFQQMEDDGFFNNSVDQLQLYYDDRKPIEMSSVVDDGYLAYLGLTIATFSHLGFLVNVETQMALGYQMWFSWERMSEEDKEFYRTLEDDKQEILQAKWAGMVAYQIAVAKATDADEVSPTMVAESADDYQRAAGGHPILNLSQNPQSPFHGLLGKVAHWSQESSTSASGAVGHFFNVTPIKIEPITAELPANFIQPGSQELKRRVEQPETPFKRARPRKALKPSTVKHPISAFIRFYREKFPQLTEVYGNDVVKIAETAGETWRKLEMEQKRVYMDAYGADMERYNQKSRVNAALAAIDNQQIAGGDGIAVGQEMEVKAKDVVEAVGGEEIITDEEVAMLQAAQELLDVGAFKDDDEENQPGRSED